MSNESQVKSYSIIYKKLLTKYPPVGETLIAELGKEAGLEPRYLATSKSGEITAFTEKPVLSEDGQWTSPAPSMGAGTVFDATDYEYSLLCIQSEGS